MPIDSCCETVIRAAAAARGWNPAPLLAIAEVMSDGRILVAAAGSAAPPIRFRPHVFRRRLRPEARRLAEAAGLACARPSVAAEPASQRARHALLTRAGKIDREAAAAACEWGFGRVCGERAKALGFENAEALAASAYSVAGQARLLMLDIEARRLREQVVDGDWRGYAAARFGGAAEGDALAARLAAAASRWSEASTMIGEPLGPGAEGPAVRRLQRALRRRGLEAPEDGVFGLATRRALRAFQAEMGLVRDGLALTPVWERLLAE